MYIGISITLRGGLEFTPPHRLLSVAWLYLSPPTFTNSYLLHLFSFPNYQNQWTGGVRYHLCALGLELPHTMGCVNDTAAGGQLVTSGNNASASKKNTSRRNAWGNLSYADLITQAISSSAETRLTLSQIYEWMVQNVPYFKDKGDSNSSAGWKVSCSAASSMMIAGDWNAKWQLS